MSSLIEPSLDLAFATLSIHGAPGPDPSTGAILTPIHQSTTFAQDGVGRDRGYTYSRCHNPTVAALECALGVLEQAPPALCFGTGMAAITTLFLSLLQQGDRVVAGDVVYGGTSRLLRQILARFGVEAVFVDTTDAAAVERALSRPTRMLLVETPANPTLAVSDIRRLAGAARAAGAWFAVDNTFMTPALQRPLDLGATISVYSTTKYIEGHNATVGGALVTRDAGLRERIEHVRNTTGSTQKPWEAWLTLRGLKTLPLRMARHAGSARQVAEYLCQHRGVARVCYPGLPGDPGHAVAQQQQSTGGGIVSFEPRGGGASAVRLLESLQLCALAENLGAAETLVTHPATMTHADLPDEQRAAAGITDGLVRLSVGLESPADIIADLEQALEVAR